MVGMVDAMLVACRVKFPVERVTTMTFEERSWFLFPAGTPVAKAEKMLRDFGQRGTLYLCQGDICTVIGPVDDFVKEAYDATT